MTGEDLWVQIFALTDWRAGFHLFGTSDKQPWSADGSQMLGMRTHLTPRDLKPDDSAQIGVIPFAKGGPLCDMHTTGFKLFGLRPALTSEVREPSMHLPLAQRVTTGE